MQGRKESTLSKLYVIFKTDPVCGYGYISNMLFLNWWLFDLGYFKTYFKTFHL